MSKALCIKSLNIIFEEGRLYAYTIRDTSSTTPSPTESPSPGWVPPDKRYRLETRIGGNFQNDMMKALNMDGRKDVYKYLRGMIGIKIGIDFATDQYIIFTTLSNEKFHKHFREFI